MLFRNPRNRMPLLGTAIGVTVLVCVIAVAIAALLRSVAREAPRKAAMILASIVLAGLAWRLLVVASGHDTQYGLLSHFPAFLDLIAVGIAAAWFGRTLAPKTLAVIAIIGLAAWLASSALRPTVQQPGGHYLARTMLHLVVAAAAVLIARHLSHSRRSVWWLVAPTLAAPGLVLFHEAAVAIVARQYRTAVTETESGIHLLGPGLPPLLWTLSLSIAFGVVLSAVVLLPLYRLEYGSWPRQRFEVVLAGVIGFGFLWRVVTMLTIAPERTDGGDPLFYHTTANMLAQGRGFSEPLNWIAFGKQIPSAVHGPMYPVVLSISSRLGGTTYFDHKMLSCLIGTGVVLAVWLRCPAYRRTCRRRCWPLAFAAVYPNLWIIDGVLFPEGLTALLTTLAILDGYRWRRTPRLSTAIAHRGDSRARSADPRRGHQSVGALRHPVDVDAHRRWPRSLRIRHFVAGSHLHRHVSCRGRSATSGVQRVRAACRPTATTC